MPRQVGIAPTDPISPPPACWPIFCQVLFDTFASFELLGYLPVLLALAYMCNNTTTGIDSKGNTKTIVRDPLHNLVHPRSAPRSRKRCVRKEKLSPVVEYIMQLALRNSRSKMFITVVNLCALVSPGRSVDWSNHLEMGPYFLAPYIF